MLPPTPSRVLTSKMKALPFHMFYREGTTDEKVMAEIFTKQAYKKPIIGFEVEAGAWALGGARDLHGSD